MVKNLQAKRERLKIKSFTVLYSDVFNRATARVRQIAMAAPQRNPIRKYPLDLEKVGSWYSSLM